MRKDYIGTVYINVSDNFQKGLYPIARTIKAVNHDLCVVEVIKGVDIVNDKNTITKQASKQASKLQLSVAWMDSKAQTGFILLMELLLLYVPIAVGIRKLRYWRSIRWNNTI